MEQFVVALANLLTILRNSDLCVSIAGCCSLNVRFPLGGIFRAQRIILLSDKLSTITNENSIESVQKRCAARGEFRLVKSSHKRFLIFHIKVQ